MTRAPSRVAVVVVTYNSADLIREFAAALPSGMAGTDWHLVVADNGSADDTVTTVRDAAPTAIVVEVGRNAGYAAGINAGVRAAGPHDAILILNPDVRLGAGCAAELIRALGEPGTGIAVPRLADAAGLLIHSMRREPTVLRALADAVIGGQRAGRHPRLGEVVTDDSLYDTERLTDWAEGSTQLIAARCWERCGPWDESYFLYSEETEYDLRARDAGFATRYVPTAHAVHLEGGSGGSPRLWQLLVVNRVRLFARRNSMPRATAFWLATLARESSRAVLGKATGRAAVRSLLSPGRFRSTPGPHSIQ